MTPLHLAAKTGNSELVRYLVLSGADVDEYNQVSPVFILLYTLSLLIS